jgi:uncharacterized protein YndB with AHSA1/START domain
MEVPVPYAFTLTTTIPASPQEIYEAWLDSVLHSQMTGGEASMSDETGSEVSAWDGYITGRNIELVPGERIVQSWRTTQFTDEHEDSQITITLQAVEDGTLLTLEHTNVPDMQRSYEQSGWQTHYFDPMKKYFANRKRPRRGAKGVARKTKAKRTGAARTAGPAARKAKAKRTRAGRTAGPAVRRAKPKRARAATRAKAKRSASKARGAVGKKTPKRAAAAKSARSRAKKTRSKTARGKRR